LEKWQAWAEEKACCDYAFKMKLPSHLNEETRNEMTELADQSNINCFVASMEDFNDAALVEFFETSTKLGCVAQVHAQSVELVQRNIQALRDKGVDGPEGFALAHSEEAEEEATSRAATLANQMNCPLYLTHVSCPATIDIISKKKAKGNVLYGEVTPAALACDGHDYWDQDWKKAAALVASPPIRKDQNEDLAKRLVNEDLDVVASNHASFNVKQKALGLKDFTKIPVGANGIEERMSVVWSQCVANGSMRPEQFVAVTSANAAKIFGLYPDKGHIDVGSQADVVIWDPEGHKTIDAAAQVSKSDLNVFQGQTLKGRVEAVILRGRLMYFDEDLKAVQGHGRFLPLSPYPAHVYERIKARKALQVFHPVERKEEEIEINGDIPPPARPIPFQPEKAASLHISNIDLKLHPNDPEDIDETSPVLMPRMKHRSSIRIRNPPGGQSSGSFW
jgi:dihydropyrimidinase